MADKNIQIKRGLKSNLPLNGIEGQPYFTMDTGELYVGMGNENPLKKVAQQQKVITFVYNDARYGQFGPFIKFPYDGIITGASANCSILGDSDTLISIDKISESDMQNDTNNWETIFSQYLLIPEGKKIDNKTSILNDINVSKNDYFRLNMIQYGNIQQMVIELVISLTQI